jgi:hypothetical protein
MVVGALSAAAIPTGLFATSAGAAVPAGYEVAAGNGGVFVSGSQASYGSALGVSSQAVVGIAATPDAKGYYLVAADGGVFAFGDAVFHGSLGGTTIAAPISGIALSSDGKGYYLVGQDGGVYAFGDAVFGGSYYSTYGNGSPSPIVSISASPTAGYVLLSQSGAVYAFGGGKFYSSPLLIGATGTGAAIQYTTDGLGYWVLQSDGGVYAFGDATGLSTAVTYAIGGASNFSTSPAVGFAPQL